MGCAIFLLQLYCREAYNREFSCLDASDEGLVAGCLSISQRKEPGLTVQHSAQGCAQLMSEQQDPHTSADLWAWQTRCALGQLEGKAARS